MQIGARHRGGRRSACPKAHGIPAHRTAPGKGRAGSVIQGDQMGIYLGRTVLYNLRVLPPSRESGQQVHSRDPPVRRGPPRTLPTRCLVAVGTYAANMKADTAYRYRLYPAPKQAERLAGWGHTCRAVWNVALAQRQFACAQRGVTLRTAWQCRQLTEARAGLDWLADLPAQSAQQVLSHLDRAYENWWNPDHPAGPPTFKKRRRAMSVPFPGQSVRFRNVSRRWAQVWLPKLGWVRVRTSKGDGPGFTGSALSGARIEVPFPPFWPPDQEDHARRRPST
jgi:hypothetical protein